MAGLIESQPDMLFFKNIGGVFSGKQFITQGEYFGAIISAGRRFRIQAFWQIGSYRIITD
jgi:hypothetical protein